jgi:hypothetical protein
MANYLEYRPVNYFKPGSENEDVASMRHHHYEKRRRNKLSIILNTIQSSNMLTNRHLLSALSPREAPENQLSAALRQGYAVFFKQRLHTNRAMSMHQQYRDPLSSRDLSGSIM